MSHPKVETSGKPDYYHKSNYGYLHKGGKSSYRELFMYSDKLDIAAYILCTLTDEFRPIRDILNQVKDNVTMKVSAHADWAKLVVLKAADAEFVNDILCMKRGKRWATYEKLYGLVVTDDELLSQKSFDVPDYFLSDLI